MYNYIHIKIIEIILAQEVEDPERHSNFPYVSMNK